MYKSTKEIQQIFDIDITDKNRTIPFMALRAFYAEDRVRQLRGNTTNRYTTVAKELGCGRDNVYNLLKRGKTFKEDKCIKIIFEAFKAKDKALINKYHKELKKTIALEKSFKNNKMFNDGIKIEVKPKEKIEVKTLSNLKLAEFLRTNKVMKHDLWNTPVKNISANQWQQVRQINKNMFDSFIS